MMMGYDWGWGGMWFGWLMMVGFSVAVIVLVVWLIRLSTPASRLDSGSPSHEQQVQSALDILQARFARGEISKEEYLDTRATLIHM